MAARLWLGLVVAMMVASCTPSVPEDPPLGLVLEPDGARAANGELRVGFGQPEDAAVAAVTQMLGEYPRRRQREWFCGVTVEWLSGYRMLFVNGSFAGWNAAPGRFDTGGAEFAKDAEGRIMAGKTC